MKPDTRAVCLSGLDHAKWREIEYVAEALISGRRLIEHWQSPLHDHAVMARQHPRDLAGVMLRQQYQAHHPPALVDNIEFRSGLIARVALERHLFTVADSRGLQIIKNPPTKKHPDVEDVLQTLTKSGVITAIQKSQSDTLLRIAALTPRAQLSSLTSSN
jgi:hypothetical protein